MHYGVTVPPFAELAHPRRLAALAQIAEEAGWDGFFIWDHILFGDLPIADAWVSLAAIALATNRIRIGPMVTPLPRRRPVKLARETVSVDDLSQGRLTLSVGIGGLTYEWEYLGEEADLKRRGAMLDEGLQALIGLWQGRPFAMRGTFYTVLGDPGATFLPRPVQTPRIPIWVAAIWPHKAPLRRAANWDGVLVKRADRMIAPEEVRQALSVLLPLRPQPDPFDVVITGITPGDPLSQAAQLIQPYEQAGATWWIENIGPWRSGWQGTGPWPVAQMEARIRQGPPR